MHICLLKFNFRLYTFFLYLYSAGNGSLDFQEFLEMIVAKMKDPEEELRNAFKFLDKDGNGTVSLEELRVIITQLGDKLSDEEVHEMFSKADVNNDGQLDYEGISISILMKMTL